MLKEVESSIYERMGMLGKAKWGSNLTDEQMEELAKELFNCYGEAYCPLPNLHLYISQRIMSSLLRIVHIWKLHTRIALEMYYAPYLKFS